MYFYPKLRVQFLPYLKVRGILGQKVERFNDLTGLVIKRGSFRFVGGTACE
jgi:hypothetical protein